MNFYTLTPDVILQATEKIGVTATGQYLELNSFENRVVEVWLENGTRVVSKFYRPNRWSEKTILEEHEFMHDLIAAEVPTVPALPLEGSNKTLGLEAGLFFSVFKKAQGRPSPELNNEQIAWLGRLTARLHSVGAQKNSQHRLDFDVNTLGLSSLDQVLASPYFPPSLNSAFDTHVRNVFLRMQDKWSKINLSHQRIHGDLHVSNLLWGDEGPFFLDFDDFGMGPKVQDFWLLMPGNIDSEESQNFLRIFSRNYEMFAEYPDHELVVIEDLRKLRQIKHAAWLAARWDDPAFPKAFPWFADNERFFSMLYQDLMI